MQHGEPLSWQHFVYGMTHLARDRARESLRLATASQMGSGFMGKDGVRTWFEQQKRAAGWG